jgi:hypothetical protein
VNVATPTLDRMQARDERRVGEFCRVVDHSQMIGDFLDFLETEGIHLGKWTEMNPDEAEYPGEMRLLPVSERFDQLLARYFGIDLKAVELEKRAPLDAIREANR